MKTSDVASRAVLFTKRNCPPCTETKNFALGLENDLLTHLSFMDKDYHSALVAAYDLKLYPTLLIIDKDGLEVQKIIGGKVVREQLVNVLNTIKANKE